jgi:hypothetical protein
LILMTTLVWKPSAPGHRRTGAPAHRALLVFSLLIACNPPIKQYELENQALSCDEANRLAYRTIEAMRFKVSEFQPGGPGQRGVIKASRTVTGGDEQQSVTITVDCKANGADIDASEDGAWMRQLEFKRAFHHAYLNVVQMRAANEQLDEQIIAGTAPASQQRRDLRVVIQPLRGQAGKLDFPFDLAAAGVLPVRIEIANLTPRTYTLDVAQIRLTRADRERVAALPPRDAAARIAGATRGNPPEPVTTASREAVADALGVRQFNASEIAPGAVREGFLYFPLADYLGARVVLTDKETGEDEGVRVEF